MDIKALREQTGLSQSKFAAKFQLSVRTLQQWEQSKSAPPDYIPKLLQRLLIYENALSGQDFSLDAYRIPPRSKFKICIDEPFKNCEFIYPIQQRKVKELITDICSNTTPEKIIVFGSSVTESCHIGSDIDIYAELPSDLRPITRFHDFEYDFWSNFSVDERFKIEILKKGVVVYG